MEIILRDFGARMKIGGPNIQCALTAPHRQLRGPPRPHSRPDWPVLKIAEEAVLDNNAHARATSCRSCRPPGRAADRRPPCLGPAIGAVGLNNNDHIVLRQKLMKITNLGCKLDIVGREESLRIPYHHGYIATILPSSSVRRSTPSNRCGQRRRHYDASGETTQCSQQSLSTIDTDRHVTRNSFVPIDGKHLPRPKSDGRDTR